MNRALVVRWARRKYKKLEIHQRRANAWLGRIARREQAEAIRSMANGDFAWGWIMGAG